METASHRHHLAGERRTRRILFDADGTLQGRFCALAQLAIAVPAKRPNLAGVGKCDAKVITGTERLQPVDRLAASGCRQIGGIAGIAVCRQLQHRRNERGSPISHQIARGAPSNAVGRLRPGAGGVRIGWRGELVMFDGCFIDGRFWADYVFMLNCENVQPKKTKIISYRMIAYDVICAQPSKSLASRATDVPNAS
jgi:hypothetical protein